MSGHERIDQVLKYHQGLKKKLPNAKLHAAMHVTVENQLAEQYEPAVAALARLVAEGLQRHDPIHAIAFVLSVQMHQLVQGGKRMFDRAAWERDLNALTADQWPKQPANRRLQPTALCDHERRG